MYAGCPMTFASKWHTETALRITKAKFNALSEGIRTAVNE